MNRTIVVDRVAGLRRPAAPRVLQWLLAFAALANAATAFATYPPPLPTQAVLSVANGTTVARVDEIVRGGVPIPRALDLRSTAGLALVDANGTAVPATFTVLARWDAGRADAGAPIQWLLVRFRTSLAAGATRSFTLRTDASVANPAPPQPLQLTRAAQRVIIDTGVARFEFGGDIGDLFERIERPSGVLMVDGGAFSATIDGATAAGFSQVRRVEVEHVDALSAVVLVEGAFGFAPIGGGLVSGGRRLEFAAGSAAVNVREWIDWEGERCSIGTVDCGADLNAVALDQWRVQLVPALGGSRSLAVHSAQGNEIRSATVAAASEAALRQMRRTDRTQPQRFELSLPGQALVSGTRADAGVALLSGNEGSIGIALKAMADYEPQALRLLASGALVADLADARVWLGARQGAFAEYRVGVFAPGSSAQDNADALWPALKQPLLALPAAAWIAASRATDEFPVGALPPGLARYDTLLDDLVDRTIALRRDRGLEGLMTFGLFPRNWGNPVLSDEIDCGADPTPADDWDDPYWCAFWTDYHNTSAVSFVAAWRSGDPAALHAISQPAAMRQLHTQLIRCAPDSAYFYCGQLPTGYGGYRVDFNSSHGYVENLILNYWLSGDRTILERLQRGAQSMRGYLCGTRGSTPPGPVCAPATPITDATAGVNDRVASQFYQMFRFVGLAGDDPSYLDDWRSNTARFLTQNFALLDSAGDELGFTETSGGGSTTIINGAGTYFTNQLWMASIYDFNLLYRLELDSGNAALGVPAITPARARHGWSRTLVATAQLPEGNGTATGVWPNTLRYDFSGARIGGSLTQLQSGWAPAPMPNPCWDNCLYDAGKSALTATLARSADDLGDPVLRAAALDLALFALDAIENQPVPMGKAPGELFGRLTSAVARLGAPAIDPDRLFADGFED